MDPSFFFDSLICIGRRCDFCISIQLAESCFLALGLVFYNFTALVASGVFWFLEHAVFSCLSFHCIAVGDYF